MRAGKGEDDAGQSVQNHWQTTATEAQGSREGTCGQVHRTRGGQMGGTTVDSDITRGCHDAHGAVG